MSRVLIAEDEDRIASFVAKGLRASGLTPTVVSDGAKALTYALGDEFDLLVLDLGLPLLDGLQVLADLRAAGTAMPIVILTARSSVAEQLLTQVWGADFDPGSNVVDVYRRLSAAQTRAGADRDRPGAGIPAVAPAVA
jgi:DNA-binding response OmpR family regulator